MSDETTIYESRRDCLTDAANGLPVFTAEIDGKVTYGKAKTEHQFRLALTHNMTIRKLTRDQLYAEMQAELSGKDQD